MSGVGSFAIYFVVDGKDYAYRAWPGVPRIGELVMLRYADRLRTFRVTEVVWGVRENEEIPDRLTCNVALELEP